MKYNLTIIIPFYNSKKFISKSLDNCCKISKKHKIEIIYIDNNSTDKSYLIVKKKIKNLKNIKLYKTKKEMGMGPGIARNLGIKKTSSENILFLDVDDYLNLNYLDKLLLYIKKKNYNFIYLNKKLISKKKIKLSPYLKYNKKTLKKFFKNSNNMQAISIVFKKDFLLKHKLKFQKGIFEDIFFIFKCHYFNTKKIGSFLYDIYVKKNNASSITNSIKTIEHLNFKFYAWKSIDKFLKQKLSNRNIKNIKNDMQYRWRGEFYNDYKEVINSNLSCIKKAIFVNHLKKIYKKLINKNFVANTVRDKLTKEKLFNV